MLKILLNTMENKFETEEDDIDYCQERLTIDVNFLFNALICYLSFHYIL